MVQYRVPREELPYDPANRKSIVEYAQKLVGRTLRDSWATLDSFGQKGNKGKLGQAIEAAISSTNRTPRKSPIFLKLALS